ncbi:MAG: helix-turn-helix domain-containing protein [Oscillospiraceae bacterium]|nr:helix-turn-helix domain-containing protein [Oscillospiraceae bacterium]
MAVGERIRRVRNLRKLTQKELGLAVGFDDKTADVRIAQYETGTRTPKEDLLRKIAEVLDVNFRSLYEPTLYAAEDVMFTLFELDEHYNMRIFSTVEEDGYSKVVRSINFDSNLLDEFISEWHRRKRELADGTISKAEYLEWKLNWPYTSEGVDGKFEAKKQWRSSETPPIITKSRKAKSKQADNQKGK